MAARLAASQEGLSSVSKNNQILDFQINDIRFSVYFWKCLSYSLFWMLIYNKMEGMCKEKVVV
jgi:hypothetical protein